MKNKGDGDAFGMFRMPHIKHRLFGRVFSLSTRVPWRILDIVFYRDERILFWHYRWVGDQPLAAIQFADFFNCAVEKGGKDPVLFVEIRRAVF